jgi:mono/diheme cytochrome c family protein
MVPSFPRYILSALVAATIGATPTHAIELPTTITPALQKWCGDCHQGADAAGNLNLTAFGDDAVEPVAALRWARVHDRLRAGEMPPRDAPQPTEPERTALVKSLASWLSAGDTERQRSEGRVALRRLNRSEYENTLRDLFAMPGLAVKEMLPEDGRSDGFDKSSDALELSAVQLRKYLEAADDVLDRAIARQDKPMVYRNRFRRIGGLAQFGECSFPIRDGKVDLELVRNLRTMRLPDRLPYLAEMDSLGIITGARESYRPEVENFAAFHAGFYRIRTSVWSFDYRQGTLSPARRMQSLALLANERLLAYFDAPSMQPREHELVVWLNAGEGLQLNPANLWPNYYNPLGYDGPCVAVDWVDVEGPLHDRWPPESHTRLFGTLPLAELSNERGRPTPRQPAPATRPPGAVPNHKDGREFQKNQPVWTAASPRPHDDARRLLADFLPRAFRRPVAEAELNEYVRLAAARLDAGDFFETAMRVPYRTALCSPDFLFLQEPMGRVTPTDPQALDAYAVAARLSYFLWNSLPDDALNEAVEKRRLSGPGYVEQVDRMLADSRSERFVHDFLDQWLELREIDATTPENRLYPGFRNDLRDAMLAESRAFFRELIDRDLPIANFVESDFLMVNGRLAEHYGIAGVEGSAIRRVPRPADSPRGGFLTQAAVLKVTANGTTTSPVLRGAWVCDRILGRPPQPPPPDIAAVDPDVRGATTIREQLALHRNNAVCASCHSVMDPPGFALESFDVIGGYRTRYRHTGETGDLPSRDEFINVPAKTLIESFRYGLPVDASGTTADGAAFRDVRDFRKLLLRDEEQLARAFVERLILYATGAPVTFADRAQVDKILNAAKKSNYGVRTLVHQVTQAPLFRRK